MPTLAVLAPARDKFARAGVTLIEMLVVVTIVGLMVGVGVASFSGGMDGLRLRTAASSVAGALNIGMRTAERRQLPVAIAIEPSKNRLSLSVADGRPTQVFSLASGVRISRILPALFEEESRQDRSIVLYPNGSPPSLMVELQTARGVKRFVRLDPLTNMARVVDTEQ